MMSVIRIGFRRDDDLFACRTRTVLQFLSLNVLRQIAARLTMSATPSDTTRFTAEHYFMNVILCTVQ